jgi:hypothetical protein
MYAAYVITYATESFHSDWIQLNFLGVAAASGGWTASISKPAFRGSWFSRSWFTHENRDGSRLPWFAHENRDVSWNAGLLARTEMILELLVYSREQRGFSNHSFTYENRGSSRNGLLTRTEMVLDTLVCPREQRLFLKLWFTRENRDDSRNSR